jgi:hypothetical protein
MPFLALSLQSSLGGTNTISIGANPPSQTTQKKPPKPQISGTQRIQLPNYHKKSLNPASTMWALQTNPEIFSASDIYTYLPCMMKHQDHCNIQHQNHLNIPPPSSSPLLQFSLPFTAPDISTHYPAPKSTYRQGAQKKLRFNGTRKKHWQLQRSGKNGRLQRSTSKMRHKRQQLLFRWQ